MSIEIKTINCLSNQTFAEIITFLRVIIFDTSRESKSIYVKSTGLLGKRATRCARLAHTLTESRTGNYGYVVQT